MLKKDEGGSLASGSEVIISDPEILSGMPVFRGTRPAT